MSTFVRLIPYNLYAITTIVMILIICVTNLNFGPMGKFEKNAIEHGDLFSGNGEIKSDEVQNSEVSGKGKVYDLIIPNSGTDCGYHNGHGLYGRCLWRRLQLYGIFRKL